MLCAPRDSYATVAKPTMKSIVTGSAGSASKNQTGLTASAAPIIVAGISRQAGTDNDRSKYF
uniref:Uncharacterized protein n=1 Tax=Glossina morsitans morsitans TaxID=37546 RepID=A0A1B0FFI6_GLOMM